MTTTTTSPPGRRHVMKSITPDDFEEISLQNDLSHHSDSSSTKSISSRDSACSSNLGDEDYETDATSTTNSVVIDPHKLNGYAINGLKSKSTQSLQCCPAPAPPAPQSQQKERPASQPITSVNVNTLSRQRSMGSLTPIDTKRHSADNVVPPRRQGQHLRKAIHSSTDLEALPHQRLKSRTGSVRLTRKQIEAQFDAEYENDIIDDSCIWNVPLSPALYAQSRKKHALKQQHQHQQPHLPHVPKHSSKYNSKSQPSLHEMPMIKETETMTVTTSATTAAASTTTNDALELEGLDRDTQDLTRKFQELPGAKQFDMDCYSKPSRRQSDSVDPSNNSSTRSSVSSTCSSQTRPSWLPPKSAEEEKKHMEQFHKLIEQAAKADKTREEKRKSQQQAKQKQEQKDEMEWRNRVIPNFDQEIKDPKTREMWWRGVPSRFRETVWKKKIGNSLGISKATFDDCLKRFNNQSVSQQIVKDADSTFPHLHIFSQNCGPLHEDLVNLLKAYSVYRSDIGYKSGMCSIAAVLLLNLNPIDSFIAFANGLDGSMTMAMYQKDDRILSSYYSSFLKVLNTRCPKLYEHFQHIRLSPSTYLEQMMINWFTGHLSIDIISRIWDVLIFEGDGFLLRVSLGLLMVLEWKLYGSSDEVLKELHQSGVLDVGDEDSFMESVRQALKTNTK